MPINPYLYPNSYAARSSPLDVARSESRTFVSLEDGKSLYHTPNSKLPANLGFSWSCSAGEYDAEKGRELNTEEMRGKLFLKFTGCMRGRTMFVIPFSMGPVCSPFSKLGIQLSDSLYVVANMYTMTRTGLGILQKISEGTPFVPCWHSVGVPLLPGEKDVMWPCCREQNDKYISHFTTPDPERPLLGKYSIMSFGSGYGGNAILGKKCYALRIASKMGRDDPDKWMAEHMLILRVKYTPIVSVDPATKKKTFGPTEYFTVTGAFPSACGKTNMAMIEVPAEFRDEWSVSTVGDDIAWIHVVETEKTDPKTGKVVKTKEMRAINPESGFFGVAPGTGEKTNANAMATLRGGNIIFTNVATTFNGDVFWDGLSDTLPDDGVIDWKGNKRGWKSDPARRVFDDPTYEGYQKLSEQERKMKKRQFFNSLAHPNSRYTTPCVQCPIIDPEWNTADGVPLDAMVFGGRRSTLIPLAVRARSWNQGVLLGATLRSETTAAVQDRASGVLNFDPFAMRPFVGYNMGEYFEHWCDMGEKMKVDGAENVNTPDMYFVNWFRKNEKGEFIWNGFSDNFRVIRWICLNRLQKKKGDTSTERQQDTPLGYAPTMASLNLPPKNDILTDAAILTVPTAEGVDGETEWAREMKERKNFLDVFGPDLPKQLKTEFNDIVDHLVAAKSIKESESKDIRF
ncbi:Phosphoenolpyruvate carboxykinase [Blattamonas nauphoetae]|uniref:phosphoenolpyruvate carboxykinase (GTP) n=1 Tax=Blattamonas nauphoetae TaxID=2049346 RepID=A0ABQ9XH84_9EUKA|nr:Phosphoenolpyruvate carboxykinase [Blattamonas nauphoetae]